MQINYNHKVRSQMFDSNYPSNKKRTTYFEDTTYLPTAERSHYRDYQSGLDRTPNRQEYLSPSKRSERLSEARRSINEAIELASVKKARNHEAIEEVRSVNQEIVSSLSSYNPTKSSHFEIRNKTADRTRDDYSRDYVATSQFDWSHPQQQEDDLRRSHKESVLSNENMDLRSRLNEEIRKNNDLLRYVKTLEGENATLRHSVHPAAHPNTLAEENRQLRSQLQGGFISADLLQELQKLKEENQLLRRDTIALLKKTS